MTYCYFVTLKLHFKFYSFYNFKSVWWTWIQRSLSRDKYCTIVIFYVFHGAGTEFKLCWVIILHLKIKLTEPSCSDLLA